MAEPTRTLDPNTDLGMLNEMFWVGPIYDALRCASPFWNFTLAGVDRLVVVTNRYEDGYPLDTILDMPVTTDELPCGNLYRAIWASYVLSMEASAKSGKNPRAHADTDPIVFERARNIIAELGATATPSDCCYVSDMSYLECGGLTYDPATRTLTSKPGLGS